ncbi:exonuclease 1 [Coniochaeta sp. 2T2.1]|nr:exonuclease 1 [Coniochaeta sp. 2T2.1]
MGIQGLLPLLKSIHRHTELKKFAGETLAVDAYGWLHRGTISCAIELAQGKPTRKYVDFAMHRVRMLKHFGVTPYMVFDGDYLPSKAGTEASREKRREESKRAGLELLKAGKPSQAHLELQKAIDVTPEMARHLIEELKKNGVPYVVAPYEADAQMVYLERQGIISGIISEDSDLLVFGAKRLLTKLDQHGQCIEINRNDFCRVREISLTGWTDTEFRHMAIFSGCDYLDSVSNMGLKTAYRMIRKHKTPEKVIRMLQFDGKFKVSENYLAAFKQAELTFLHQRVYCPVKQELVFLTDPDPTLDVENMPFIGAPVPAAVARLVATGELNPMTKEPIILEPLPSRSPKRRASSSVSATGMAGKPFGKPIESYFKGPRRIPLGEMDPNCFAVEPNQVASLAQNGLLPRVFPLPRPYVDSPAPAARPYTTQPRLRRRQTEPLHSLLGLPAPDSDAQARRRTAGPDVLRQPASTSDSTQMRPPKKARLCEDLPTKDDALPTERSKFFAPKPKTKQADTILFSDDSIEEALLELPDIDESWSSRRKSLPRKSLGNEALRIFDDKIGEGKLLAAEEAKAETEERIPESDIEVPASSPPMPTDGLEHIDTASETPARRVLSQFSYTPQITEQPSATTRTSFGLPTPALTPQLSAPQCKPPSNTSAPAPSTTEPSLASAPSHHLSQRCNLSQRGVGGDGENKNRRKSYDKHTVNPAFVPLPKVDVAEVQALNAVGSEDLIVPDSEGEGEEDTEEKAEGRLELSRFMYG